MIVTPAVPQPVVATEKFVERVDFGVITVPDSYHHENQLHRFRRDCGNYFRSYNDQVNDKDSPSPSHFLKPEEKFRVRAFEHTTEGVTTSEERIEFLKARGSTFVGAHGLTVLWAQKRSKMRKGNWYVAFDEEKRLWSNPIVPLVPYIAFPRRNVDPALDFNPFVFDLGGFRSGWVKAALTLDFQLMR